MPSTFLSALFMLALMTIVFSCQSNHTMKVEAINEFINNTRTITKKPSPKSEVASEVFISPKYGFEVSIPLSWKSEQPYPIDLARSRIEVYPKTANGYDVNQKLALRIPILILSIEEWKKYKQKEFEDYPYIVRGADSLSIFNQNDKYVFILENRWEYSFDGENDDTKINTIRDVVKTIRPY